MVPLHLTPLGRELGGLSSCVEVVLSVVSQQSVSTEYTWGIIRDLPILHKAGAGAGLLVDPTTIWLQVDVHVEYHKGLLHFHHSRNEVLLGIFKRPVFDMCAGVAVESSGMMGQTRGMEQHRFRSCDIAQWRTIIPIEMLTPKRSATRTTSPRTGFRSSTSQVPTAWRC